MKNLKDIIIGIFAGIGMMSLLMGSYSPQSQTSFSTPQSHVWKVDGSTTESFLYNKVSGEIYFLEEKKALLLDKRRITR